MEGINLVPFAALLAGISFGILGIILIGAPLWPQLAEQAKRNIVTILLGLILVNGGFTMVSLLLGN